MSWVVIQILNLTQLLYRKRQYYCLDICPKTDILCMCKTTTQVQKMLSLLVMSVWLILGAYCLWFLFKAKTVHPLTLDDLALTWKLHKQQTGCKATRIHSLLMKHNEVVGFKCNCGYKFIQQRLITQKAHNYTQTNLQHLLSSVGAKQTPKTGSLQNPNLPYTYIESI